MSPFFLDDAVETAPPRRKAPQRAAKPRPARDAKRASAAGPKGPLVIAVSLQRQQLKVFDRDGLYAEAPVSTGMRGHATPAGIFSILQNNKWHRSNIYSGAPMPYMQRLTWSGIALHAGALPGYPASHGCIRMPNAFAARLWQWTRRGARVVISHGEVAPAAITHPLLDALPAALPLAGAPAPDSLGLRPTLGARGTGPRTADATDVLQQGGPASASDAPAAVAVPPAAVTSVDDPAAAAPPKRYGPISVFISRSDGRLYARQDFEPLFDVPVTIADPDRPIGTHVFTARRDPADRDRIVWTAMTLTGETADAPHPAKRRGNSAPSPASPSPDAGAALDRLQLSQDVMARIVGGIANGASLIVADQGLKSGETGQGTEFVLFTR